MLKSRCNENARATIKDETNTREAWKILEENKPRGSGTINSTIKKFEGLTLASCNDNIQNYTNLFRKYLREFRVLYKDWVFNPVWLIYYFYSGLGEAYSLYWEQYDQNHDPFKEDGKAKFTLDYAIQRFLNTMANPAKRITSSAETQAMAALVNSTFAHNTQSVIALVATGNTEIKVQPGANAGNSRIFT